MARAGAGIIRKEAPVQKYISSGFPVSSLVDKQPIEPAPARAQRFKIKIYIDELEVGELWSVLFRLPPILIDVIKEEWFWWTKLYQYEISCPVDWEREREKGLVESRRRIKKIRARGG